MMRFDLIWGRMTRVLSFCVGLGIMVYETVGDSNDRPWLYAAAVGMMGLPVARYADNVLSKIGASSQPVHTPGPDDEGVT